MKVHKFKHVGVVEFHVAELAVRLFEAMAGVERPESMSAEEAMRDLQKQYQKEHDQVVIGAQVAIEYFLEQIKQAQKLQ